MDAQHEDMSFTDLLCGNSTLNLGDSPPLTPINQTSVKKSIRGVNFNIEEDKLIVSAWLNCSLDAVQGTDQKHSQFWEKILEYFEQHKETTIERSAKSLSHRWSCIQKATNSFCSYLAQVEGLHQSGLTKQDEFEKAKIMYQKLEKCNFLFEHCWHLLKDQPKWISRPQKDVSKQKRAKVPPQTPTPTPTPTSTPSPTPGVIENEIVELDRPTGRKAEKEKRKAKARQDEETIQIRKRKYTLLEESCAQEKEFYRLKAEKMEYDKAKEEKKLQLEDERLRLEAEKLRLEADKVELAKKESDQRIMMMDLNVLPEMQRLYYQALQREIMARHNHA